MDEENEYEHDELSYLEGYRAAWLELLQKCLSHLDYGDLENKFGWIIEREEIVTQLRSLCKEYGDNNWNEKDYLPDIIKNHLSNYLYEMDIK
ncbi:MAG TPA: hypothetical protein DDY71_05590 [Spirochaetia bacterium]|nr:hypothetical protein [Spirochaetia bacterium]